MSTRISKGMWAWDLAKDMHVGCSPISPGCDHCMARQSVGRASPHYTDFSPQEMRDELLHPIQLVGGHILVSPMSDPFHPYFTDRYTLLMMQYLRDNPRTNFSLLTKRVDRMRRFLLALPFWPLLNVNIGTSAENQEMFDLRVPILASIQVHKHAKRFVDLEPLLSPIHMGGLIKKIGLVIFGGERGSGRRPFKSAWGDHLKMECEAAGVHCYHHRIDTPVYKYLPDGWRRKPSAHNQSEGRIICSPW